MEFDQDVTAVNFVAGSLADEDQGVANLTVVPNTGTNKQFVNGLTATYGSDGDTMLWNPPTGYVVHPATMVVPYP